MEHSLTATRCRRCPWMRRDLRMRRTWHFEVISGVFKQEGGHVGWVGGENHRLIFFFPENEHALIPNFCVSKLWKRGHLDGKQSTGSCSGWDAAGSYTYDAKTWFKVIEIWKKQKFFLSPLLLLSCQILLSCSAQAWHRYGNRPGLTFHLDVLSKWTLHLGFIYLLFGCTNI